MENDAALRVTEYSPCNVRVFELFDTDFASKGAIGLVEDILSSYFKVGAEVLAGEKKIKGWRGDDNFCITRYIISLSSSQSLSWHVTGC